MAEVGIDIAAERPKRWTDDMVEAAEVVVTMGWGDACPFVPGRRYLDRSSPWLPGENSGSAVSIVGNT